MDNSNTPHEAIKNSHSKPHILFVCGRNKWRSPTAVRIYKNDQRIEVRSAGISTKSKHQISTADVEWADLILVMEKNYIARISWKFGDLPLPRIENLDIPDEFEFMDEELIDILTRSVEFYIRRFDR